ncbi:hypothetical protein SP90_15695 [Halodesulfovibrio spirochaetisodalis]|uniref:Uncharacterized protein n=1 Tax=Halodesulfovibrio spirochaetisodalis TaxID=1560234 RepID=A0A1B7X911_9BACT|nr:hypothetical protein SP90_15695 [Halodesulfovibrio spirochaetisodalis]
MPIRFSERTDCLHPYVFFASVASVREMVDRVKLYPARAGGCTSHGQKEKSMMKNGARNSFSLKKEKGRL